MDFIELTHNQDTKQGLMDMLEAAEPGMSTLIDTGNLTDVSTALLVIEIAKIAQDRPEWFPRGKWATIQAIQERCGAELSKLF